MKKRIIPLLLILALVLAGCGSGGSVGAGNARMQVVTTTYPIYLFTSALTRDVDGVVVERLDTGSTSCLHDYTLSVNDMKKLADADVIAMNGAGLEDFMDDALAASSAAVIDCSQGVALLENADHIHEEGDGGHDHGHWDPHYWMDPDNAGIMAENIAAGLIAADPDHQQIYQENMLKTTTFLASWKGTLQDLLNWDEGPEITGLITFHDGFAYFAKAFDLEIAASMEIEAGSEPSARELEEIISLLQDQGIPAVFTEINGTADAAELVARETGCAVFSLDTAISSANYLSAMTQNIDTIKEALG